MRRCIKIGAIGGFLAGTLVFLGYIITSWWVCTTLLDCPGHWLPYLIIYAIGVTIATLIGLVTAVILHTLYRLTRV